MALLRNIVDEIIADLSGGIRTDESRRDAKYIESKIHAARAILIRLKLAEHSTPINPAWAQPLDLRLVDREVEDSVVYFECPQVITTDDSDGFIYVGHKNRLKPFGRINSVLGALSRTTSTDSEIVWRYESGTMGRTRLVFYNNHKLTYPGVDAIFDNPTEVLGFRQDTDDYPVDNVLKKEIVEMVTLDLLRKERIEPDYISDSQDKPTDRRR